MRMDRLHAWLQAIGMSIPFMVASLDGGRVKLNWTRIVEAAVIAIAGGLLAGYISVRELTVEIRLTHHQNQEKNAEQDKRIDILCDKIDKIKDTILDKHK